MKIYEELQARGLIAQGGISVNGVRVDDLEKAVERAEIANCLKVRKGKKIYHKFMLEQDN